MSRESENRFMELKTKALAIIGDGAHPFDDVSRGLQVTLGQGAGLEVDFSDDVADLNAETLARYKLLITARGASRRVTAETGQAVKAFVTNGGAALFLHNSSHLCYFGSIPDLREVIGGSFIEHSEAKTYRVEIANAGHPIARGVADFNVAGEQHFVVYDGDPAHVFLRNRDLDGRSFKNLGSSCVAGWAYDYGRGRICFMSPGHSAEVYLHPEYQKLQRNAVGWLLRANQRGEK
ncbi:MAG: ThuA domain-containing protein [Anaerolineae bacterium]|nr:ThuA domain-containing protein [Anaerolineae bacterium]